MEFYFPTEFGEQLAFVSAAVTALIGLFVMFAPGLTFRFCGLQPREGMAEGFAAARSYGGMLFGFAGGALLLAQPMVYLAFGAALAMSVFGRILSVMSDGGTSLRGILLLIVSAMLASLPIAYVFGLT